MYWHTPPLSPPPLPPPRKFMLCLEISITENERREVARLSQMDAIDISLKAKAPGSPGIPGADLHTPGGDGCLNSRCVDLFVQPVLLFFPLLSKLDCCASSGGPWWNTISPRSLHRLTLPHGRMVQPAHALLQPFYDLVRSKLL